RRGGGRYRSLRRGSSGDALVRDSGGAAGGLRRAAHGRGVRLAGDRGGFVPVVVGVSFFWGTPTVAASQSLAPRGEVKEMTNPPMLEDISRLLLALAAPAALLCLVLAGIALRREGGTNFSLGGGFSRWMFWTVVFITLPPLLSWFPSFGVPATAPSGGIGIGWMASVASDLTSFVTTFVVNRLAPVLAAFFVLRAVLDVADGSSALGSVIAAFLLSIPSTAALLRGW